MSFDYSGKTVFVAGGTSGINLGVAKAFAGTEGTCGIITRMTVKLVRKPAATALAVPLAGWTARRARGRASSAPSPRSGTRCS